MSEVISNMFTSQKETVTQKEYDECATHKSVSPASMAQLVGDDVAVLSPPALANDLYFLSESAAEQYTRTHGHTCNALEGHFKVRF